MYIGYFDEVKYQEGIQPYEWLAGILIHSKDCQAVEAKVNALAASIFGDSRLTKETEFHASAILNGSQHWKSYPLEKRIEVLKGLADILADKGTIKRVYVRIDPAKLVPGKEASDFAFLFFVEKVNQLLKNQQDVGLLIGDFEHESAVNKATHKLLEFRTSGTPYEYGQEIDRLIDTVHFCRSHHSRLLQLADAWAWFAQLPHGASAKKPLQQTLIQHAATTADILWPDKFKIWPPA